MDENRKKLFKYVSELNATAKWVEVVKRDAVKIRLTADAIYNGKEF